MAELQKDLVQPPTSPPLCTTASATPSRRLRHWLLVSLNTLFLIVGQSSATLLSSSYFNHGGNSKWISTLTQMAAFPLLLPLLLLPSSFLSSHTQPSLPSTSSSTSTTTSTATRRNRTATIYVSIGLLVAADDLLYTYGVSLIPVSTYSLLCATQLAFNSVLSFFLNSQKFTSLILNSVFLLTLSSIQLALRSDSDSTGTTSSLNYAIGFGCTLAASFVYALILCLMQLAFQKHFKNESFSTVINMQLWTSAVATLVCIIGLFGSGEWKGLKGEYENFQGGKVAYLMVLIWTAIAWQVASIGVVGLVFAVSSLFSNVVSTLALPVVPVVAIILFKDHMDSMKVIALVMSLWGCASYVYQQYKFERKNARVRVG